MAASPEQPVLGRRVAQAERYWTSVVVALSALVVGSHVLGATVLRGVLWGTHFYGFLPPVTLGVAVAATVAAYLAGERRLRSPPPAPASVGPAAAHARRAAATLALAAVAGIVFWALRIRHTLLGDSGPLSHNLPLGEHTHPRQPLSLALHHVVYEWTRGLFEAPGRSPQDVAYDTVALGSVVAGVVVVPVTLALARHLVRPEPGGREPARATAPLAAALLLTQGYVQFFFGYVENYTWFTLACALFLWAGLSYLRGGGPLVLASLALAAAIGLNISGVVLLPSLAVLVAWGVRRPGTRRAAVRDMLLTVAILFGLELLVAALGGLGPGEGFRYLWGLVVRGGAADNSIAYLFSAAHLRDSFALHMLIGPFAALLLVPVAVYTLAMRGGRTAALGFLLAGAAPALAASWTYGDPLQGVPRDWDLFAPFALVYAATAIYCMASTRMRPSTVRRLLLVAVAVSVFHTGSWVLLNTSTARSLERYKVLPATRGRTEMVVGYWYLTHGQNDLARQWFERSVAAYVGNNAAQYQLGLFNMDEARFREAAEHFRIATEVRPDKTNYRFALADALVLSGRPQEALPHLELLRAAEPGRAEYWGCYGIVLLGVGRTQEAGMALAKAASLAPGDPRYPKLLGRVGEVSAYARAVQEDWDALVVK